MCHLHPRPAFHLVLKRQVLALDPELISAMLPDQRPRGAVSTVWDGRDPCEGVPTQMFLLSQALVPLRHLLSPLYFQHVKPGSISDPVVLETVVALSKHRLESGHLGHQRTSR